MTSKGTRSTVLVTGGAGYVGSHACKALARAGYLPVVYDNLSRSHAWAVKWGPFERGDLLTPARLAAVIKKHRPIAVLHFAALAYVGESVEDPPALLPQKRGRDDQPIAGDARGWSEQNCVLEHLRGLWCAEEDPDP